MRKWKSQDHVRWSCLYHIVIVTKYRKKSIYKEHRKEVGKILRRLCEHMGFELVEGHAMAEHVHLVLSIPPKMSVATVVGRLKGKSAILIHNEIIGRNRNFKGCHFWARGYCASTVGLDEETIRNYVKNQDELEKRLSE